MLGGIRMTKEELKDEILTLIEGELISEDDIMEISRKVKNDNKEPA